MSDVVVLASKSPRRQTLLAALGVVFSVDVADVDEMPLAHEPPVEMVIRLSRTKAMAVAVRRPGATVLAADTVVALDSRLLGKPMDDAEALAMLRGLRGRSHQVYTAVSIAHDGALTTGLSRSEVWMRSYGDEELQAYIASGDPLDKAGAYAIQHPSFSPVEHWIGCYTGIMGLPLGIAAELLVGAGVPVRSDVTAVCEPIAGRCCRTT